MSRMISGSKKSLFFKKSLVPYFLECIGILQISLEEKRFVTPEYFIKLTGNLILLHSII